MIKELDNPEEGFIYFLKNADNIETLEEKDVDIFFTKSQLQRLDRQFGRLIDGIINKFVMENHSEKAFYSKLWQNLFVLDNLLDDDQSRKFALGRLWLDVRIPYFRMEDGIKMSNEEYGNIIQKHRNCIKKIDYILNYPCEQRTETSSRINKVLAQIEDEKEKAVIMSQVIYLIEQRTIKKTRIHNV